MTLFSIYFFNSIVFQQLIEDSDELWEQFCKKEFKNQVPDEEEDETWRDLYFRCGRERDEKLKNITQNISHKQSRALPGITSEQYFLNFILIVILSQ